MAASVFSNILMAAFVVPLLILAFAASQGFASDPDPLQDICVANLAQNAEIPINGLVCKNPNQVLASDFSSRLLRQAGGTSKSTGSNATVASVQSFPSLSTQDMSVASKNGKGSLGSTVTLAVAQNFPDLNTQGMSLARIDFKPKGLNPPHIHPRATEVLFVVQGTLEVGFVTATSPTNTLFQTTLSAGDLFIFPRGVVHFQFNADAKNPALSISGLNSQNPGLSIAAEALFDANPPLQNQVLEKAFGIKTDEVKRLIKSVATTIM